MRTKIFKRGKGHYCRCKYSQIFYSICLNCLRFISETKLQRYLGGKK